MMVYGEVVGVASGIRLIVADADFFQLVEIIDQRLWNPRILVPQDTDMPWPHDAVEHGCAGVDGYHGGHNAALPEGVELFDGGTAGADLIDVLADRETVIIVDAVRSDKPAGTILRFGPDDLALQQNNPLSLHDLDIPQTLAMTKMMNCAPKNVICFGVVPECISPGMELSETLADMVPQISQIILGLIHSA